MIKEINNTSNNIKKTNKINRRNVKKRANNIYNYLICDFYFLAFQAMKSFLFCCLFMQWPVK